MKDIFAAYLFALALASAVSLLLFGVFNPVSLLVSAAIWTAIAWRVGYARRLRGLPLSSRWDAA